MDLDITTLIFVKEITEPGIRVYDLWFRLESLPVSVLSLTVDGRILNG
jgi:hypothetical protein